MATWLQILIAVLLPSILIGVIWNAAWLARISARLRETPEEPEKDPDLREILAELKNLASDNKDATEQLRAVAKTSELVAELAGDQMQQLLVNLARLGSAIDEGAATSKRIEQAALTVADDLSEAHARADEAGHEGEAGAAADAAARQTIKEKRLAEDG